MSTRQHQKGLAPNVAMPIGLVSLTVGVGIAIAVATAFGGGKWAAATALVAVAVLLIIAQTRFALYFVAALIPLQVTLDVAGMGILPTLLAAYGIFAITAARALCGGRFERDPSRLTWLLGFLVAAAVAAAALGLDPGWSATRLIHLGAYFCLMCSVVLLVRSVDDAVRMVRVVMVVSVIVGLIGVGLHLTQFAVGRSGAIHILTDKIAPIFLGAKRVSALQVHHIWEPGVRGAPLRAVGPFLWPPVFAMYIELVLPLWLAALLFGRRTRVPWTGAAAGILIFCVAATFVRGAWLTFPFAAAAMWYAARRAHMRAKPTVFAVLAGGALVVFLSSALAGQGAFLERLRSIWQPDYASNLQRFQIWTDAVTIVRDHPVLGVGPGNFSAARYGARASELARPHVNAHNMYMTTACELGIIGLAALVLFYGRLLSSAAAAAKRLADERARVVCIGLVGSFVWIGLNSMTDDALYEHRLFGIFWILAGVVAVLYRGARAGGSDGVLRRGEEGPPPRWEVRS